MHKIRKVRRGRVLKMYLYDPIDAGTAISWEGEYALSDADRVARIIARVNELLADEPPDHLRSGAMVVSATVE